MPPKKKADTPVRYGVRVGVDDKPKAEPKKADEKKSDA